VIWDDNLLAFVDHLFENRDNFSYLQIIWECAMGQRHNKRTCRLILTLVAWPGILNGRKL